MPPLPEPWNSNDNWTAISEVADRLIAETKDVQYVDEEHKHSSDPDGTIVVTLERDGECATIRFPIVKWLNDTGRTAMFDQFRQKFENSLNLDGHGWGILQERWLHRYLLTNS